jgi:type III secretion protein V
LVDPATQIALHVNHAVRGCAFELVGIQETQQLLDDLEATHPALVHEVVPRVLSVHTLSEVLRRLVDEGISIRNLREILQALAEWAPVEKDPVVLAEHARAALQRYITHKHAGESLALRALLLDPAIEDVVRESIRRTNKGSYLAIEPDLSREIVQAVLGALRHLPGDEPPPVVLTNMEIRRYVRRLLEAELPELAVLSYNELRPTVQVQPVARVSLG